MVLNLPKNRDFSNQIGVHENRDRNEIDFITHYVSRFTPHG